MVTLSDGTIMHKSAYIAQQRYEAERACHESRAFKIPQNPTSEQVLAFAISELAKQNKRPCAGTNENDVEIARTKARWSFAGIFAVAAKQSIVAGEIAQTVSTIAKSRVSNNTTYSTRVGSISQSNKTIINSESNGGNSGASSGGNGGNATINENAERNNQIVFNRNGAIARDNANAGDGALLNADSGLISSVNESEIKGSDTAREINKPDDSSSFDDNDGGNGAFDL